MAEHKTAARLYDREIEALTVSLIAKAAKTAITIDEYVQIRLIQGATMDIIRADLLYDLENGGRIFGEFLNAVKATTNGSLSRFRDVGQFSEIGVDETYMWAAVLVNTCPDCLERHGQTKTWEEWEAEGLPRTGFTVCREHCKCMLVPKDTAILQPIKRG